uniref:Uncharacterized protein n=1 Tax=Wuchereria bancrofti TaxID=6293 RepID=A0A1I8EK01_WUCBA
MYWLISKFFKQLTPSKCWPVSKVEFFRFANLADKDFDYIIRESEEKEFVSDLVEQGVPTAEVMENVEAYLKKEGNISVEEGIRRLEAIYRKYKQVEQQLTEQKLRLVSKLPDLEKSVKVINHLEEKSVC